MKRDNQHTDLSSRQQESLSRDIQSLEEKGTVTECVGKKIYSVLQISDHVF